MTRKNLIQILQNLNNGTFDSETTHQAADTALLEYINDVEITAAYNAIQKWYA